MMPDKPIIMSAPMVRALLARRKHMTRRVLKPQPPEGHDLVGIYGPGLTAVFNRAGNRHYGNPYQDFDIRLPYMLKDRLWVREAIYRDKMVNFLTGEKDTNADTIYYRADDDEALDPNGFNLVWAWKSASLSPRFMPRWASRITLIVTDVRVERVQDISEEDAKAEGAFWTDYGRNCFHKPAPEGGPQDAKECGLHDSMHPIRDGWSMVETTSHDECLGTPRYAFANLWNSLHKPGNQWDDNPWVAAISFETHTANIDAMRQAA